jgi:GTPase SAR1 family protein
MIVYAVILPLISALSYPGADIVLLCFSTVSQASYDAIREKWYPEVNHYIPDVPSLLVGTKMDMREADKDNSDNVSKAQGEKLAKEIESEEYLECSAKTTQGLAAIFNRAVDIVLTVYYTSNTRSGARVQVEVKAPRRPLPKRGERATPLRPKCNRSRRRKRPSSGGACCCKCYLLR